MTLLSLLYNTSAFIICFLLLIAIIVIYKAGSWLGQMQRMRRPDLKPEGLGALEGSLMGLLALLLSFTFSMSATRFDARRLAIVDEANSIGTAILQADLYPDSIRNQFRQDFKLYVESRIAYFDAGYDQQKVSEMAAESDKIASRLWRTATKYSRNSTTTIPHSLMVPSLNKMIDAASSRDATRLAQVPDSIMWLLILLTILVSMIIGYSKKEKGNDWIILALYSLMTVMTIFTIMDLDRPYRGLIDNTIDNQKIVLLKELFTK